jgi:hypothetical protein
MTTPPDILLDAPAHVQAIETRLDALETALRGSDTRAMDDACGALQRELAEAMAAFHHATSVGIKPLSPELLQRLILAQARVTALQPVVHRAVASIDRTLGVLLSTPDDDATYMALGAKVGPGRLAASYKG